MSDEDMGQKDANGLPDDVAASLSGVMEAINSLQDFLKGVDIDVAGETAEETHEDKH